MSHVFVSYSRKDSDCAQKVLRTLQIAGFPVWQDVVSLKGGDNFVKGIRNGIQDAAVFVVLWSENAQQSEWVNKEIDMALDRHTKDDMKIVQIQLDNTAFRNDLSNFNAVDGCTDSVLQNFLIPVLPKNLRWQIFEYLPDIALDQQTTQKDKAVPELLSLQLMQSGSKEINVYLVGHPNTKLVGRPTLPVALRFSQRAGLPFLSQIVSTILNAEDDFLGLYITGPFKEFSESYWMDDDNPAQWLEAINTIVKAIDLLTNERVDPLLQIFSAAPQALAFGLGLRLFKFQRIELFNYLSQRSDPPYYQPVLNSMSLLLT